nr:acrosin [Rousettus aegyptiacus]
MQERYVERIVIHDRYRPGMEVNDIALLKITPPVLCGRFVGPGCLPQFAAGPPSIPQKCWVIGWGYLRENALRPSPVLQEARVDLLDLDMCNSTQWYGGRIYSTNVCAGYPHGRIDTCQGDSGGPLMCKDSVENAYVVVGVTSWGVGCARAKRPGIYTSTWPYLNWIASKIGYSALKPIQIGPSRPSTPSDATKPPPSTSSSLVRPPIRPPIRPPDHSPDRPPYDSLLRPPIRPPIRPPDHSPDRPPYDSLLRPPIRPPGRPPANPPWYFQPQPLPPSPRPPSGLHPRPPPLNPPPSGHRPPHAPLPPLIGGHPQALSFAKRLEELMEILKGKTFINIRGNYGSRQTPQN